MSQTLWVGAPGGQGIGLGDPFTLLKDFAEMAHACAEAYGDYPDLFAVPGLAMDDADASPLMGKIQAQADDFKRRYGGKLSPGASSTLDQLVGDKQEGGSSVKPSPLSRGEVPESVSGQVRRAEG
jgi:hypothetical protein